MKGLETHFVGRLSKDADARTTKSGKAMTVLTVVSDSGTDDPTWITVLLFEDQAERLAGLPKGTEVYAKGKLKAALYQPEGGEPRVSLTLLATHVEPMTLERKASKPRPPAVYGDRTRKPSTYARPARGGEDFNDAL